jgi:serine/threonine protein kinase
MLGKTVSHYRILEAIGSGGMGVVYRAEDLRLGRQVALKFLPRDISADAEAIGRFRREARAASALNHPNICTIYDVDEADGMQFIAMELLEGETLRERIARGPLELTQAVRIAAQIADALDAAHVRQIVHRDIKPANIFLTRRDTTKLLDFGLAKLGAATSDSASSADTLTRPGISMGTIAYMSPEQARGEDVDARSDLFSLGAVLHEMVTGKSMFPQGSPTAIVFDAILNRQPQVPSSLNSKIPARIDNLVRRATAKDRAQRYFTAAQMRDDLLAMDQGRSAGPDMVPSIAVLPFSDMSPQKDQDYFCEGIAEELLNALTQVEGLRVVSRTSSFQFKGRNEDIRSIGEKLNVDCVLEGSVRKAGNKLRVTAQLVKATNGYHLWSDRFDRDMEDIFAIQDEIASTIVDTLRATLGLRARTEAPAATLVKRYTDNVEAYNLYLQGRHFWGRRTEQQILKGIECFKRAIEIDSSYALAYSGLVESLWFLAVYGFVRPREAYLQAKAYAENAISLDDALSEAHYATGVVRHFFEWDWEGARVSYSRAIELNPRNAAAHSWFAYLCAFADQNPDKAIHLSTRAMELEPYSPYIVATAGYAAHMARNHELARTRLDRALELDSEYILATWMRAMTGLFLSEGQQSVDRLEKVVSRGGRQFLYLGFLGGAYGVVGSTDDARKIAAELEATRSQRYVPPMALALVYRGLGNQDRMFQYLDEAVAEKDPMFVTLGPEFDEARRDARFQKISREMKLPRF